MQLATSIKSIKYIYRYIYKGHDKGEACLKADLANTMLNCDGVKSYIDARYLCAPV